MNEKTEGKGKQLILDVPEGWGIGRSDCLGRVLGDLTKEAYFFVTPENGAYTAKVRIIKVTGDGTVESIKYEDAGAVDVLHYCQLVCVSTLINDNPVEGAAAIADVQATVTAWDGFNDKLNNGYGVLAWQEANGEGSTSINDIIADGADNDAPAVYYNLQGVRVDNPANGVYIVRKGNKTSKVLVK